MSDTGKQKISVVGAGMVGVSVALELQRQGCNVTLWDAREPGQETSRWNAGVLARSSLIPLNNPQLLKHLPAIASGKAAGARISFRHGVYYLSWLFHFLRHSRGERFRQTVHSLNQLIELSIGTHKSLLAEAGASHLLNNDGWFMLYRSQAAFEASAFQRDIYDQYQIAYQALNADELSQLEPVLTQRFARGLWIKDSCSLIDPHAVVSRYFGLFHQAGGVFQQTRIQALLPQEKGFAVQDFQGALHSFDQVVLACGAWSKALLKPLGLHLPLAVERGYMMQYALPKGLRLQRPIYDVGGAYVASPRPQGVQLSTGVDLTRMGAKPDFRQLYAAQQQAKQVLPLGKMLLEQVAVGNRPSLPDSRPAIGQSSRFPKLWLACGHQHIGFSTGPGTAKLLTALMLDKPLPIDVEAFTPGRWQL